MNKIKKIFLVTPFVLILAPYLVPSFNVEATSGVLATFNGAGITGGSEMKGNFVPNNYVVVVNTISRWQQPTRYNGLTTTLRIKSGWGYSNVASSTNKAGTHTINFVAHKGQTYDLYFHSSNYNYWNSRGTVYANK